MPYSKEQTLLQSQNYKGIMGNRTQLSPLPSHKLSTLLRNALYLHHLLKYTFFLKKKTHNRPTKETRRRSSRDKHCLGSPTYSTAPTCDIVDYPAVSCLAALAEAAVPAREDLQVILAHQRQAPAWKRQRAEQRRASKRLFCILCGGSAEPG